MTSLQKQESLSNSASASAAPSQGTQQSQPVSPWSAHAPRLGKSPSPFPRDSYAISTRATTAGELFLFGGDAHGSGPGSLSNDLYSISTRDFSTTLLPTKGDVPSPRYAHCAVFIDATSTLFIWGGATKLTPTSGFFGLTTSREKTDDGSLYMLNLSSPPSRDWIRIKVNGPWPGGRCGHTMTSDGSNLFIFGGKDGNKRFNDIWAFDLNCLESNPFWESYEPTAGNQKPVPRASHVSIMTGDRIIIFGGFSGTDFLNDTWSFSISTRKWTELQCTGSIPSPRYCHTAVLIDDVMYVYGGRAANGTYLGDLTVLNLSTQRWTSFQDIETGPCGRAGHTMASDGRQIIVYGGEISPGRAVDEAKSIHVLDTKLLNLPKPDSNTVKYTEKTIQLVQKLRPGQLHLKGPTGLQHLAMFVTPGAPPGKEPAESENRRLVELERQLSETLVEKNEQGRRIARLTDELALKCALLERAEANTAEEKKRARRELRELQVKLDESLMSRDRALEQAQNALQKASAAKTNENLQADVAEEKKHAGLELRELQANLEESPPSRDHALEQALQKASRAAAEANENLQSGCAKSKEEAASNCNDNESAPGPVNADEDPGRIMQKLMERVQAMEAMATMRWNEKSFEMMECRNED